MVKSIFKSILLALFSALLGILFLQNSPAYAVSSDSVINLTDYRVLRGVYGRDTTVLDVNGDGRVDFTEARAMVRAFGAIGAGLASDTVAGTGLYNYLLDDSITFPVSSIALTLNAPSIATGESVTISSALATYSNGDTLDVTNYIRLGSSDTNVILPQGESARAVGVGSASVYAVFAGTTGGTTTVTVPAAARFNLNSPLGTNLSSISYFTTDYPFVDAFKSSRPWVSTPGGTAIDLDSAGWVASLLPGQFVTASVFVGLPSNNYPTGRYIVLYEGSGTITYGGGAAKNFGLSAAGRDVLDVTGHANGIILNITATTGGNYIRNIRLIMPGGVSPNDPYRWCASETDCPGGSYASFETSHATQIFHPDFLNRLKTYRSIRFGEWAAINNSALVNWSDRPLVSDAHWSTETGVPLEVMIELANRIQADPWFTLPHQATDDFASNFAALVRDSLAHHLKSYVEHSNEVWNTQFNQATYVQDRGNALALAADSATAGRRYHARRSVEIFNLWRTAFGGSTDSFYRVIATQASSSAVTRGTLEFENAYQSADMLAIAPYIGGYLGTAANETAVQAMTLNQLMTELTDTAEPGVRTQITTQKALADSYGLEFVAYEGGQHLARIGLPANATINTLFENANRDARMGTIYTTHLNYWRSAGGRLFNHFVNCNVYNTVGRWGALEYPTQPRSQAPKFDALQSFIEANPKWWSP